MANNETARLAVLIDADNTSANNRSVGLQSSVCTGAAGLGVTPEDLRQSTRSQFDAAGAVR